MASDINLADIIIQSLFYAFPTIIKATWPLIAMVVIIVFTKIGIKLYQKHKFTKAGMGDIDVMSGQEFESFLATLFQRMGYSVKQAGSFTGDYGADLVILQNRRRNLQKPTVLNCGTGLF